MNSTQPLPLALQVYSVRSLMKERLKETLAELSQIGFRHLEWSGPFGGLSANELTDYTQSLNLNIIGMFASLADVLDPDSFFYDYARAFKPDFLTLSFSFTPENYQSYLEDLNAARAMAADQGFTLTYHNHAYEFQSLPDGRLIQEALFEDTAEANQLFLFDTFFAAATGYDPCAFLQRYQGRIPQIHLNDLAPMPDESLNYMAYSTELGTGILNLPAIYRAAKAAGVNWIILEQHKLRDNPLESARQNFDFYQKLLRTA